MSKVDASVPGSGLSTFMASGADGSTPLDETAQVVSNSAIRVFGYWMTNVDTVANFVSFYGLPAASVTVGTTPPKFQLSPGAATSANLSLPYGIDFPNGCSVAATTTAGGNTGPVAAVDLVVWYAPINLLS